MTITGMTAFAGSLCLAGASIWAGMMDLTSMKIRNEIVVFLLATYAALAPLAGFSYGAIGLSLLVSCGVLVCTFTCFGLGWIGGGDAKLMTVTALWLGADQALSYLVVTAVLGGLLTVGIVAFRTVPLPDYLLRIRWIAKLHALESGIPYGVAIATGALFILPQTPWLLNAT